MTSHSEPVLSEPLIQFTSVLILLSKNPASLIWKSTTSTSLETANSKFSSRANPHPQGLLSVLWDSALHLTLRLHTLRQSCKCLLCRDPHRSTLLIPYFGQPPC